MILSDKPIEKEIEDRLGRVPFSKNLSKSIIDWKGTDSLVVALYGKWGSGKSSVINLTKSELIKSKDSDGPTLIEFNPWFFSGEDKLNEHFFNEIAKELEIQNSSEKDIELASKLRSYSRLFGLIPDAAGLAIIIEKSLIVLGLLGVSSGQILQWLKLDIGIGKIILFIAGIIFLILLFFSKAINGIADNLERRGFRKKKTVLSYKQEIKESLIKRKNKILIIIDDIDRLTPEEVRLIFKLIKINTDFPNVIYLLSFDREVVQKALEQQPGISGQDYIEKIVQVSFDIPLAKQEKIANILFDELDRVLTGLPKSSKQLFDQTYWGNVYHSGLKNFFRNIRDVKRFASSLEFSFALMFKEESMEVNPIDFIAIEAVRVFSPEFYEFMRVNKELFVSTKRDRDSIKENTRKNEIENGVNLLPDDQIREDMKELLTRLFPQVEGVFRYGYSSHGSDWIPTWNRHLRVCSPRFFDAYFTLIPGGDESELSQFEVDSILGTIRDQEEFEKTLREFIENSKIRKVLKRLEDYTEDKSKIPDDGKPSVVQTLFNVSDELPTERHGMFDFGSDLQCARIITQLLKRDFDKENNFKTLKAAIENSKGLYGPIYKVALESQAENSEKEDLLLVPKEKLTELHKACLVKINEHKTAGTLKTNLNLLSILYRWKEWSDPGDYSWVKYIEEITSDDQGLIDFIELFISESYSHTFGDYVGRKKKSFNYKSLGDFIDIEQVKTRLEGIKNSGKKNYMDNKESIDMFLDSHGKKKGAS
jgi:predicted KAP-like P-loop ATPase